MDCLEEYSFLQRPHFKCTPMYLVLLKTDYILIPRIDEMRSVPVIDRALSSEP